MENAAKALEIAGGVLIALLVLGLLVFGYNNLASVKKTQQDVTAEEQATDFNKKFETYNKEGLYGSQIFSLANMIHDYNATESDKKGYTEVKLDVTFGENDFGTDYFNNNTTFYENKKNNSLTDEYEKMEKKISDLSKETYQGKTFKQLNSMTAKELSEINGLSGYDDYVKYNKLITEQTDISRLTFKKPTIEYDKNTGRINSMSFEQK